MTDQAEQEKQWHRSTTNFDWFSLWCCANRLNKAQKVKLWIMFINDNPDVEQLPEPAQRLNFFQWNVKNETVKKRDREVKKYAAELISIIDLYISDKKFNASVAALVIDYLRRKTGLKDD